MYCCSSDLLDVEELDFDAGQGFKATGARVQAKRLTASSSTNVGNFRTIDGGLAEVLACSEQTLVC
jgi:hypothetical protein